MTIIFAEPAGPPDPVLFDVQRDMRLPGGVDPIWVLSTFGADQAERLLSPQVIEGDTDVSIELRIRTSELPPRERIQIATLAGVLLELDDAGLHWMWRGLDRQTSDRLAPGWPWKAETWHEVRVLGDMRVSGGTLSLFVDDEMLGTVVAEQTWSLDNPRSWLAGVLNIRSELAAGSFDVEISDLRIVKR